MPFHTRDLFAAVAVNALLAGAAVLAPARDPVEPTPVEARTSVAAAPAAAEPPRRLPRAPSPS